MNRHMQLPTFEHEMRLTEQGLIPIGIDEAGRGPLAGPVVAAAVVLKHEAWNMKHGNSEPASLSRDSGFKFHDSSFAIQTSSFKTEEDQRWKLVRDSKKLSEKQREEAYAFVQEQFYVGVGIISAETIDRVNILQATFLAMKAALASLKKQITVSSEQNIQDKEVCLLIDGNQKIPNISLQQETIVDGDGLVKSIAAASIIAKVTRDRLIILADHEYPAYGFARHKGYGTREHMDALRKHGPTPIHRRSFRPVQLTNPETVNKRFSGVLKPKKG